MCIGCSERRYRRITSITKERRLEQGVETTSLSLTNHFLSANTSARFSSDSTESCQGQKLCILGIFIVVNFSTSVGHFENVLRCSLERRIVNACNRREIKNWHYRYLLIVKLLNRIINGFVAKEGVRVEEVQLKWTAGRRARLGRFRVTVLEYRKVSGGVTSGKSKAVLWKR